VRGTPPQSPRALPINQSPCHLRPFTIQEKPDAVHDGLWLIHEGGVTCIGYQEHPRVLRSFGPFLCAIEGHVGLLSIDHTYRNLQLGEHGTKIKIAQRFDTHRPSFVEDNPALCHSDPALREKNPRI